VNTQFYLVLKLRTCGAKPPLFHMYSLHGTHLRTGIKFLFLLVDNRGCSNIVWQQKLGVKDLIQLSLVSHI
jgi:hypothetical protein